MQQLPSLGPFENSRSFLVRDALHLGLSRGPLRSRRLDRPFHGVRSRSAGDSLLDRVIDYTPRLRREERFSHASALALLGCPVRVQKGTKVDVEVPMSMAQARPRGVRGHRRAHDEPPFLCLRPEIHDPVPIVPRLRAVRQAAEMLPFPELVIALDHLLRDDDRRFDPFVQVAPADLSAFAETVRGRGARRFREAAALARIGAESRMETLLRLSGVRVGMPELKVQADLYDAEGEWIGRFDAVDFATRSIFEYDGEQHFTSRKQRRRDPRKHQAARDAGWRILVFYQGDLLEGLRAAGARMLEFSGHCGQAIRPSLAKLLDEFSGVGTESAAPRSETRNRSSP